MTASVTEDDMNKLDMSIVAGTIFLYGCAGMGTHRPAAQATLQPTRDNAARGNVTFTPAGNKLVVMANVSGLAPGPHGFHIHEHGDCSAADGSSAGDHFNPDQRPHGPSYREGGHAGDLGNLIADSSGVAQALFEVDGLTLDNVVGHSVIVHANGDDLVSQPSGNAGPRLACGPIALQ
jgi:Cu-Zn family superoxide dismutase